MKQFQLCNGLSLLHFLSPSSSNIRATATSPVISYRTCSLMLNTFNFALEILLFGSQTVDVYSNMDLA